MTLEAGSVVVDDEGIVFGMGAAYAIYLTLTAMPSVASTLALPESMPPDRGAFCSLSSKVALLRGQAEMAIALANGLIPYLTANAVVSASASVTRESLGRAPDPLQPGAPILAPAEPVAIPVRGTIT